MGRVAGCDAIWAGCDAIQTLFAMCSAPLCSAVLCYAICHKVVRIGREVWGLQLRAQIRSRIFRAIFWPLDTTASFQKFNLETWARTLGDLNFQSAFRSERKQWFWDSRPSIGDFANRSRENRPCESANRHVCVYIYIYIYIYIYGGVVL